MPGTVAVPPPVATDSGGMLHSGVQPSGEFATNQVTIATSHDQPDVRRYVVKVETSVGESADGAAAQIERTLDSARGWAGTRRLAFSLVNEDSAADFVIYLASPATVDQGCGDLYTGGLWSCRVGNDVFVNADRWFYGTPTWAGQPIDEYRAYVINHEVGHYIGFGHVGCPAAGVPSPVMQQQSIQLNGCLPNAWPDVTGENAG